MTEPHVGVRCAYKQVRIVVVLWIVHEFVDIGNHADCIRYRLVGHCCDTTLLLPSFVQLLWCVTYLWCRGCCYISDICITVCTVRYHCLHEVAFISDRRLYCKSWIVMITTDCDTTAHNSDGHFLCIWSVIYLQSLFFHCIPLNPVWTDPILFKSSLAKSHQKSLECPVCLVLSASCCTVSSINKYI